MNNALEAQTGRPDVLTLLYGVLFRPRATFAATDWARSLEPVVGVQLLVVLVSALTLAGTGLGAFVLAFVALLGLQFVFWGLSAAFAFVLVRAWGREADFWALLAAWGAASAPLILAAPLDVLSRRGEVGAGLAGIASLALLVWIVWLWSLAVRRESGFGGGQAVWVVVLSQALIFGLPFAVFLLTSLGVLSSVL